MSQTEWSQTRVCILFPLEWPTCQQTYLCTHTFKHTPRHIQRVIIPLVHTSPLSRRLSTACSAFTLSVVDCHVTACYYGCFLLILLCVISRCGIWTSKAYHVAANHKMLVEETLWDSVEKVWGREKKHTERERMREQKMWYFTAGCLPLQCSCVGVCLCLKPWMRWFKEQILAEKCLWLMFGKVAINACRG